MTSTISCNSKAHQFFSMYLWSMRKNLATIIVYSLFLLFSFPLLLLFYNTLTTANIMNRPEFLLEANATIYPIIYGGILMLFTLLVSVFMFSYLHKKRSVDMFGALPMSRRTLFFSRYLAGLTILLVPLLIATGISALLNRNYTGANEALCNAMLCLVISTIVSYTFTAFIAVCCGTTADTVISVLAINGLYLAAVGICQLMSTSILPGVITEFNPSVVAYTAFSPYVTGITSALAGTARYNGTFIFEMPSQLLWWFILAAACFAGCIILSRRRKAKSAQAGFAFRLPALVVRFIACVTVGLLFALIFGSVSTGISDVNVMQHHLWFVVGLVIGSFITHMVVTFIYNRGVKGFLKSLIPYGVLLAIVLAGYSVIVTGLFGCDVYVPRADEVKSVQFAINDAVYNSIDETSVGTMPGGAKFEDKEQIEEVVELHSEITGRLREKVGYPYTLYAGNVSYGEDAGQYNLLRIRIEYTLQNGSKVLRDYKEGQYDLERISKMVQKLTSAEAYKKQTNALFMLENKYITNISSFSDGYSYDQETAISPGTSTISDRGQLLELTAALRQDILKDGNYGIYSQNAYTAKGIGVVGLEVGYQIEDISYREKLVVPETYERTWEVLGRFMMRPVDAEELKNDSYAQELFRVPDPAETDTFINTLNDGEIEEIKNNGHTSSAVTFQPPESWDQENIYCSLIIDMGDGRMPFDTKFGQLSKCEKKNGGSFSYSLPSMVMWGTIQFYDGNGNATQKIDISGLSDDAAVVPDRQLKTDSGKTFTLFTLR